MATIKDVAQRAGVGVGTVSRVLNQSGPVSSATRERVLQAINDLRFRPNFSARHLATAQTFTIGVILPFLTRPFYVSVLRGIEAVISDTHYNLHIYNVETAAKRDYYLLERHYKGRVDGLLIMSIGLQDEHVARLQAENIPIVLVDAEHPALPSITIDNVAGAQAAVEHLIGLGHRRIGYISGVAQPELGFRTNVDRLRGYQAALAAHELHAPDPYILMQGDGYAWGVQMTDHLLRLPTPPTAIFAATDELAMGALQAARQADMGVPDDLAIVGYDDIDLAPLLGLTTMRQPMAEMGQRGVDLLLQQLTDRSDEPPHITLPVELVARATTVGGPIDHGERQPDGALHDTPHISQAS